MQSPESCAGVGEKLWVMLLWVMGVDEELLHDRCSSFTASSMTIAHAQSTDLLKVKHDKPNAQQM